MESLGKQNFEHSWREVFSGAEGPTPDAAVWMAIDSALSVAENNRNKARVVFYQRMAAALLLLTAASFGISYWTLKENNATSTVASSELTPSKEKSTPETTHTSESLTRSSIPQEVRSTASLRPAERGTKKLVDTEFVEDAMESAADPMYVLTDTNAVAVVKTEEEKFQTLTPAQEQELAAMLRSQIEDVIVPEKKLTPRPYWLAVGAAGGNFATQTPVPNMAVADALTAGSYNLSQAKSQPSLKTSATGTTFSIGVLAGKYLSRKWMLQGGVAYWKQQVDYESNLTDVSGGTPSAFSFDYISGSTSQIASTTPYTVHSTVEFISIPVQVGYLLVDRKIGWMVNAGVATDIFISNTLSDGTGQYKEFTQRGAASTLYQPLSWSAQTSTEISLRLNPHYRVALVPALRYSLTNTYRDNAGSNRPVVFDVGLRFRYIF